jgi:hypothetical protein
LLDAFPADSSENKIFFITFTGGYRISNGIPAAAVQQAMAGACSSRREIALFDEIVGNAAQGQVSGDTAAGRSTAYYNYISFNHDISYTISKSKMISRRLGGGDKAYLIIR